MFKAITVLAVLAATATAQGKVNFEREFDDFPGFRYTPWDSLSSYMQGLASMAGYTIDTWDNMGSSNFEGMAWSDLESDAKGALKEMGFYESTWDCYVNHYSSYSWSELVQEDLGAAARVLGVSVRATTNAFLLGSRSSNNSPGFLCSCPYCPGLLRSTIMNNSTSQKLGKAATA